MKKEPDYYYKLIPIPDRSEQRRSFTKKIIHGVNAALIIGGLGVLGYNGVESILLLDDQQRKREEVAQTQDWLIEAYARLSDEVCVNPINPEENEDLYWACENVQIQEEQYGRATNKGLSESRYKHEQQENGVFMFFGGLLVFAGGFSTVVTENAFCSESRSEEIDHEMVSG
ncbi:MAG: hypothetical protein NUV98_06135 [Candidatus Roizmanbacteria bacterium]|nr:hypothetical protein [Candidatus Roizmanbacteria bacterium]